MGNVCIKPGPALGSPRGGPTPMATAHRNSREPMLVFRDPNPPYGPSQERSAFHSPGNRPSNVALPEFRPPNAQPQGGGGTPTTTTTTSDAEPQRQNGTGAPEVASRPSPVPEAEESGTDVDLPAPAPYAWQKGKLIGQGAFGRVYKGLISSTGQEIAVKQVSLPRESGNAGKVSEHIKALESEVAVLRTLRHDNIVQYLGTERTDEYLNIFLEYVPGGSLANKMMQFGHLREETIQVYTKQILRGLEYLHQKKIMHRDIKGANILTDSNGIVKLADFGASKKIEDLATIGSGCKSIKGTPFWMAPEVIKQTGHGRPADIWSLGCVVIEMATGKPPWSNCHSQVAAMFHIASTKDPPPLPDNLSPEAKDFLLLCFNRVPKERPNATRLLKHPWLLNVPLPIAPPPLLINIMPPSAQQHAQQQAQVQAEQQLHAAASRSPPSPIKEETDSRFGSPAAAASPAPRTAGLPPIPPPQHMLAEQRSGGVGGGPPAGPSRFQLESQNGGPQQQHGRPMVPPLPLDAMKQGLLPRHAHGLPHQAVGRPPVPPPAVQQPVWPQQYDTITSPEQLPSGMAAAAPQQQPNAAKQPQAPAPGPHAQSIPQPQQQPARPDAPQPQQRSQPSAPAPVDEQLHPDDDDMCLRASTMTLSGYNPMEEPSWAPHSLIGGYPAPAVFRQLAAIKESGSAANSPGNSNAVSPRKSANWAGNQTAPVTRDQARGLNPTALPTLELADTDTHGEHDQPLFASVVSPSAMLPVSDTMPPPFAPALGQSRNPSDSNRTSLGGTIGGRAPVAAAFIEGDGIVAVSVAAPPRPRESASRRMLEEAGILLESGTDQARAKRWRDELMAEMDRDREKLRATLMSAT